MDAQPLTEIESLIDYQFQDKTLLESAFTHASCKRENPNFEREDYQRLEFLGDAVIAFILADILYQKFPEFREGEMTLARSALTQGKLLSEIAKKYRFDRYMRVGSSERRQGVSKSLKVNEDAVEALIGAVYCDGGLDPARRVLLFLYGDLDQWLQQRKFRENPKGELQEWVQGMGLEDAITYKLVLEEGLPHERQFTVEVWIHGTLQGRGVGRSRKDAEQGAAKEALCQLKKRSPQ